ncbi:hypothetical protein AVEN_29485-1 [Araneus ventricosus]|uniref:Uncharacterized protein n=1 Tax=Araneus ventricosus TaxID=182803 RepID=A0A4Y2K3A8_ARAVE|nr:hypothetical protein AVEN_29485-1 [Araneus ventricosus]
MYVGLLHVKSYVLAELPSAGVVRKFGEEVPAQVSSSSSDRGRKLRGPSQNRPCVASKRGVNVTKLKITWLMLPVIHPNVILATFLVFYHLNSLYAKF